MKKGVWRSKISWLFLIHHELSENQKKIWFFTVFWGDLEGAGWFRPPCIQATSRSLALLGLIWRLFKNIWHDHSAFWFWSAMMQSQFSENNTEIICEVNIWNNFMQKSICKLYKSYKFYILECLQALADLNIKSP